MTQFTIPYGKGSQQANIDAKRINAILTSSLHAVKAGKTEEEIVHNALNHPVNSPTLEELSVGKKNIVILCSDHTRPVPSKVIIPQMLKRIRSTNSKADITLLIATGCHRAPTEEELIYKFGKLIVENEKIVAHNCDDEKGICSIGTLPSGGEITINQIAYHADLLVSEGFIEPHFFAGYSGGRKSVFPGCCNRKTVMYNHNAEFINSPYARVGILDNNPIHIDMIYAARKAKLAFICNVIINDRKEVVHAVAGDLEAAHAKGVDYVNKFSLVEKQISDIVITSNGGYPLDQNVYQAIKSMSTAEACVKPNGVIIVLSESSDGIGSDEMHRTFRDANSLKLLMQRFLNTPKDMTQPDQWQSQIFARVLLHASVVFVSSLPDQDVRDLHMIPAHSLQNAITIAESILNNNNASITIIPNGVAVIPV